MKLSCLQLLKVQIKWHILSHSAGLNSKYSHFYGRNKMSKNNEIQRKSEHKIAFPAKWRKCTCDLIAFSRRFVSLIGGEIQSKIFHIRTEKCVSNYGQNVSTFKKKKKSVHLHCYGFFKWRLHVFHQLSNSYHCILEDQNQMSKPEKWHFAFCIFHEQRFPSFTSKFVT